ncbi:MULTISPECIES: cache domain-containing protein [Aerosakkonema]|uniref:cache domain-containing protein n=1 Tax=Aerosakkonema TaxID=1246629 RepID=UPI0035B93CC8
MDSEGNPTRLLQIGNAYDPRVRPWYKKAVQKGKETWSEIYIDFKEPRLKVTLAEPIYGKTGELRGVVGVDFILSHMQEYKAK